MNNFKIYYYSNGRKIYLDGSRAEGYSYKTAINFARDNASNMPTKRIYVENGDTMKDESSYVNNNGFITVELY